MKKLRKAIEDYDGFKLEIHDFDTMALDQLKFLQKRCSDKFKHVMFRFTNDFSKDGFDRLKKALTWDGLVIEENLKIMLKNNVHHDLYQVLNIFHN